MSRWTHISASILCNITNKQENKNDFKLRIEKMLGKAPKITGSEGNADVFVNILSGYNLYDSCDCDHCVYGDTVKHVKGNTYKCDASFDYKCPTAEYQDEISISIAGDLRDRIKEDTEKEFKKFAKYVRKHIAYEIRAQSCTITEE